MNDWLLPRMTAWKDAVAIAIEADRSGVRRLWIEQGSESDPLMLATALAGETSSLRFGVFVGDLGAVAPAVAAKQLASAGAIIGGRIDLGGSEEACNAILEQVERFEPRPYSASIEVFEAPAPVEPPIDLGGT
jgi:alkanesulfonate monooxygenase SsuD/methylene tetrahydromethanopterin reductase-like flavin-dependent oxidoreductase (luciferase family)